MPDCKKCGKSFEVPENAVEMAYATHCKPCIKEAVKKFYALPLTEQINKIAKHLFA